MKIEGDFTVDTNILVYFFNADSKYYSYSRDLILNNIRNVHIVHKSITEFVSILSKLNKYNIIETELSKLVNNFKILFPDNYSLNIFNELITKYRPVGNRVYDFEIISVSLANNIAQISTINTRDFKQCKEIKTISLPENL